VGGADLRFLSPQPDTSLHCQTTDTGLVHRTVCLCVRLINRWYLLRLPTEGWPGWVDLGGWFASPQTVTDPGTNRARRRV